MLLWQKTNKQETPYLNIHQLTGKLKYKDIGRKLGQNSSMGVGVSRGWGHLSTNYGLLCYGMNIVLRSAGQKSGPTVKTCHQLISDKPLRQRNAWKTRLSHTKENNRVLISHQK